MTESFVPHIEARGGAGKVTGITNGVDLKTSTRRRPTGVRYFIRLWLASSRRARSMVRIGTSIAEIERCVILATLASLAGHKRRTAETLGVSLKTLYTRLSEYEAHEQGRGAVIRPR